MVEPYGKVALFDFDGTIHAEDEHGNSNSADIAKLTDLRNDGVLMVVTTGNGYDAALGKKHLEECADILIVDVGAVVARNYGGDLINRPPEKSGQWSLDLDWSAGHLVNFHKPELRGKIETQTSKGVLNYFLESDFKICYTLPKIDPSVQDLKRIATAGQRNPAKMFREITGVDDPKTIEDILFKHMKDSYGYRKLMDEIVSVSRQPDAEIQEWLTKAQEENRFQPIQKALEGAVEPILRASGVDMYKVNVIVSSHLGLGATYVDVIPAKIDKGTSGQYILSQLKKEGLIDDKTIVIAGGDSRNDLEMHTVADYFIAVGNSNPELIDALAANARPECKVIYAQGSAAAGLMEGYQEVKDSHQNRPKLVDVNLAAPQQRAIPQIRKIIG